MHLGTITFNFIYVNSNLGGYIFTQELESKGNYEKIAYFPTGTRLWELLASAKDERIWS